MAESSKTSTSTSARQTLVEGGTWSAGLLLVLVIFAMVNYLALRHYKRFDWTGSKLYTLSEKSENVLKDLPKDIELVVALNPGSQNFTAVDELLDRYVAANPQRIIRRDLDTAKSALEMRQMAEKYGIERDNVLIVASGTDKRLIEEYELAEYDYSGAQYGQPPTLKEFKGEKLITSAILALVEQKKPKILFTKGHGEASIAQGSARSLSSIRDQLGKDNFDAEEWSSLGQESVPAGTDLVVVAGPTANFLPPEVETFRAYLKSGGRMLFLLDPAFVPASTQVLDLGLKPLLAEFGIVLGDDIVLDTSSQVAFFGPEALLTTQFGSHEIVRALGQTGTPVMFQLARSVTLAKTLPPDIRAEALVSTSSEGWGETSLDKLDAIAVDGEDLRGPVTVGVGLSLGDGDQAGRLVVFGDSDFVGDAEIRNVANGTLAINTFNWLVAREQLIEIEGRKPEQTRLLLASNEIWSIVGILFGMPALAVAAGIYIAIKRRR